MHQPQNLMRKQFMSIGKFCIPWRPWDKHDCKANGGQFLYKNKNKHRQFVVELLENDRNLKKVRLNFTSKPKGYLLQKKEKSVEAKRRSNFFKLEKGKIFLKWQYFIPFNFLTS